MPIPIPSASHVQQQLAWSPTYSLSSSTSSSSSYPDFVRELASQAPRPYGTIPPRRRRKRRKSAISEESSSPGQAQGASPDEPSVLRIQRRMSHVEDWIKVDSKESLPDDDELSPSSSLLSQLFSSSTSQVPYVLPLHVPPPNLSNPSASNEIFTNYLWQSAVDSNPGIIPSETVDLSSEEEDIEDMCIDCTDNQNAASVLPWSGEQTKAKPVLSLATVTAKRSLLPTCNTSTGWTNRLRQSLNTLHQYYTPNNNRSLSILESFGNRYKATAPAKRMALPKAPKISKSARRSEANTEPRIDLQNNVIRRDIRANPDHLRIIVAELNMMRSRKVLYPLKPRNFLPRRKDIFVRGESSSKLRYMNTFSPIIA